MQSFESAKSKIISSALGVALGMVSSTPLADVATKIASVVNRGAWNAAITASGGSITIPKGYHNGSGKVTGPTIESLGGGTLSSATCVYSFSNYGGQSAGVSGNIYTVTPTKPSVVLAVSFVDKTDGLGVNISGGASLLRLAQTISGSSSRLRAYANKVPANTRCDVSMDLVSAYYSSAVFVFLIQ